MTAIKITHAPEWPVDADRPTLPPSECREPSLRPLAMPPQYPGDDRVTVRPMAREEEEER
jgi:hypothetical protein